MPKNKRVGAILFVFVIPIIVLVFLILAASPAAARPVEGESPATGNMNMESDSVAAVPTLTVSIISPRYVILDNNNPAGTDGSAPRVYVVEAVITNTSGITAENLLVTLDYNDDPLVGWVMQTGADPQRTQDSLAPGEVYYAYWFASYPSTPGLTHVYTVTAQATGFDPVSTSENYYGPPDNGGTVQTRTFLSTGNSGVVAVAADIVVGVAYTVSVDYDLGSNPRSVTLGPAGNNDFDASTSRLISSSVRFHSNGVAQSTVVDNRLYFPEIPNLPNGNVPALVETTYTFLALRPSNMRLCPYGGVGYNSNYKYDNRFCEQSSGTVINIEGTLSITMTKTVDQLAVEQGELLQYTLAYTNDGSLSLGQAWIWDEIDPAIGRIVATTIVPEPDLDESSDTLVAWDLGTVAAGTSGTFTVTVLVDGNGADLVNGHPVVNNGFFGINPGSLPQVPALTATTTSLVQAPVVTISKSDGLETIGNGEPLVYTVTVTNDGPVSATGLVITDVLPVGVNYGGGASGSPDFDGDKVLNWPLGSWPDIGPGGGSITLTIPVSTKIDLTSNTVLTNTAEVSYENRAGYRYQAEDATDMTTVVRIERADLAVSKADDPDPVAAGSEITYTISYTNNGPSDAFGVVITDDLSANAAFIEVVSQSPDIWTLTQNGQQLTWESTGLTAGQVGTIVFKVFVQPSSIGAVVNDVAIDSDILDPDLENNIDQEVTSIGDPTTATIYGFVFDDLDGDGEQDAGEPGIEDALITLDDGATTRTDADGLYYFLTGTTGTHKVEETDPNGYFSTTDNLAHVTVSLGTSYRLDFGDAQEGSAGFASILGTVYNDVNYNGLREDGELGLPGVSITLDESVTALTDIYGRYTFSTTVAGSHKVVETDPASYISTTDNDVQVDVALGDGYQVDFGDVESSSSFAIIMGTVFKDMNGNSLREAGELGIPGVTITLDVTETTTTDEYGRYTFATDSAGVHSVAESDLIGYFSTTPNLVRPLVSLGLTYQVDFGDAPNDLEFASIHGTVFEDLDSSGSWDPDEVGLKGVTVTLNSTYATMTDLYGRYSLVTTQVGENSVEESDPLYYFSTTPNFITVTVNLANGYEVDFGDVPAGIANCPADSYEEDDLYSEANDLLVGSDQSHDFCDDPVDWYKFNVTTGNLYTITTSSWGQRADTFLALFDSDGQEMLLGNDDYSGSSDFSSQLVWLPPHGGDFYLRVTNRADLLGIYTEYEMSLLEKKVFLLYMPVVAKAYTTPSAPDLKEPHLSSPAGFPQYGLFDILGPTGVITHMCMDDFEIDDTWTSAVPIASGETQLHSFDSDPLLWAADKDFVSFNLLTNQAISFSVTSITGTSALLELYDDQGLATGLSGVDQLVFDPGLAGGQFYLSATPVNQVFGCTDVAGFNLSAEFKPIWQLFTPALFLNYQAK